MRVCASADTRPPYSPPCPPQPVSVAGRRPRFCACSAVLSRTMLRQGCRWPRHRRGQIRSPCRRLVDHGCTMLHCLRVAWGCAQSLVPLGEKGSFASRIFDRRCSYFRGGASIGGRRQRHDLARAAGSTGRREAVRPVPTRGRGAVCLSRWSLCTMCQDFAAGAD